MLLCSLAVLLPKIIAEVRADCKANSKEITTGKERSDHHALHSRSNQKLRAGFALALVIALLAKGIEALLPFDVIGASVIAMFIGMLINGYRKPGKTTAPA